MVRETVGGYTDWTRQQLEKTESLQKIKSKKRNKKNPIHNKKFRLSYRQKEEHKQLSGKIDLLEKEASRLETILSDPSFFKEQKSKPAETSQKLADIHKEIDILMERWMNLDDQIR